MIGKVLGKTYMAIIIVFLYAPILVLVTLSFNSSRSRVVWSGFTLKWYGELFDNSVIMSALGTTMALAVLSAVIACIIGLFAALGIFAMRKRDYRIMLFFTNIPLLNADIVTGIALMLWLIRIIPLGFSSVLLAHI
ncbi:MAG: ABC transporter permease, partial [Lachnospiraceae bacterium]|nr:ABC transporter permease [Lachnospiraceae bacterium]